MKKLFKNNHFIITSLILFITLISFIDVIINNDSIFILYGDSSEQYYQFLLGFWEKFHSGDFSQFDWSLGFGANGFSLIYYNMLSPFTFITFLLKKEWIQYAILYLQILKLILLGNFTCLWLSKLSNNKNHVLIGSLILTFSGWCFFYWHYDYLNSFIFYPLILFFIEKYLQDNKKLGFIICVFLLTVTNYYFMYMFVPFICLYTLFRYLIIHDDNKFKVVALEALKFFGLLILSILLGSFILIPCINIIFHSTRLSSDSVSLIIPWKDMYKIITSLLSPIFSKDYQEYFITKYQTTYQGWGGGASIYTSFSLLMFIPTLLLLDNKKKRNCLLILGLILIIFMVCPYFYKLFQGTIDTRFFYMFTIYMVMVITEVLDNYKKEYFKYILITFIALILLIAFFIYFSYKKNLSNDDYLRQQVYVELILIGISFISIILIKTKQTKLLLIPIILECLLSNMMFVKYNEPIDKETIKSYGTINDDIVNTIKDNDDGFYRILGAKQHNQSYETHSMGVGLYSSVYNYEMRDFYNFFDGSWAIPYLKNKNSLYTLTGAKYWYPTSQDSIPPFGYEQVEGQDYYINKYYVELGWVNNNTINEEYFDTLTYLEQYQTILDYVATNDSNNKTIEDSNNKLIAIAEQDRSGEIYYDFETPVSDSIFYIRKSAYGTPYFYLSFYYKDDIVDSITIPYDKYMNVRVIQIDESDKTIDKVILKYDNSLQQTEGIGLYYQESSATLEQSLYNQRTQNCFTNVVFNGDYISGDINIDIDNSLVFTQVPYDKGWKVTVDGKQIEYSKVNGGFIGFYLDSGNHTVEFEYTIPYLYEGIAISIVSLLLLVIYVRKVYRNEKTI